MEVADSKKSEKETIELDTFRSILDYSHAIDRVRSSPLQQFKVKSNANQE